jgi:low temperature requirement protein LtrA
MLVATVVPAPARYVFWAVALGTMGAMLFTDSLGRARDSPPVEEHHLCERLGLLTIIVCGESFVKVSLIAADGTLNEIDVFVLSALFVLVFSMWWSYFDDVPESGLSPSAAGVRGWLVGHLALQICLIGIAIGFAKLLSVHLGHEIGGNRTLLVVGPVEGIYLSLALIGVCTRRVPPGGLLALRLGSAVVAGVLGFAIWQVDWVDPEWTAALLATFTLVHSAAAAWLRRRTSVSPG